MSENEIRQDDGLGFGETELKPAAASETAAPAGFHVRFNNVTKAESLGRELKELRERNNFTLQDIHDQTMIKVEYLEALENEDYSRLPQPVYVLGYVRKLCSLYRIPSDQADVLTAGLRDKLAYELPEDINKSVVDRAESEENERKIHQLLVLFMAGAVLIFALLIAGGFALYSLFHRQPQTTQGPVFNPSELIELLPAPKLKITELEVP